jgi:hypothetical protein
VANAMLLPRLSKNPKSGHLGFFLACKLLIFNDAKITGTRRLDFFDSLSCDVVFGISLKNAPFETQVINLDLKTGAIFKGNFPLDYFDVFK